MIDIVYVILHYLAVKDTLEAIKSITLHSVNQRYKIIVVDNGSPDGSGQMLEAKYASDDCVTVLQLANNLGFAKGNNAGIKYAISNFSPKFVVVMNNDVMLLQNEFYARICEEYQYSGFAVLGPEVETADGRKDSSPVNNAPVTLEAIKKNYNKERFLYLIELLHLYNLLEYVQKLKQKRKSKCSKEKRETGRCEDIILHGCCWIFSEKFFEKYNGLDESTFLYHEEEILYLLTKRFGLKMVYNPAIKVYHKEDASSNEVMPVGHKKRMFKLRNCLYSSKQLVRICEENNRYERQIHN